MRMLYPFLVLALFLTGCGSNPSPPTPPAPPPAPPLMKLAPAPAPPTLPVAPGPANPPAEEIVKAQVGVGKQGRSLDEHEGMIVTPVKSLFSTKEFIAFEIQLPQALLAFDIAEGRPPKSHEEFWEKVIVANNLQPGASKTALPELPEGQRYMYDPQKKELMVVRPAKQ